MIATAGRGARSPNAAAAPPGLADTQGQQRPMAPGDRLRRRGQVRADESLDVAIPQKRARDDEVLRRTTERSTPSARNAAMTSAVVSALRSPSAA